MEEIKIFRMGLWFLLLGGLTYGLTDRILDALSDGKIDGLDLGLLTIVCLVFVAVTFLYPNSD